MTLSRTARILLALLLLAAAAFFWVNFFTQSRVIGEDADGATPATAEVPPAPAAADADDAAAAPVEPDADALIAPPADADAADADAVTGEADVAEDAVDADEDATEPDDAVVVVTPEPDAPDVVDPPVVVVDPPVTLARDVVVADLPFLITEPPVTVAPDAPDAPDPAQAERALAAARATVNPFSPVVRPAPPAPAATATAPEREVPGATPGVTEVAVPGAPPAAPARIAAPTPRPLAPAPSVNGALARSLPSGTPLAATPSLLRETRAVDTIDRATVPEITTVRIPEAVVAAPIEEGRAAADVVAAVPELLGTETSGLRDSALGEAPLAAGTNRLARYLRDNGYSFTGSVLGPVSVGVFRSNGDPVPQVVALGQTLPNTEIVLTDLRGQQAELMLDDIRQILILDIRR